MKNCLVSIIIPVYNVEKYIAKCATTLFEQDFDSIEYIFVNDCSPDNSMQVLQSIIEKYPNRKDNIKIINNTQNSGSSLTRKNGLNSANGEYILFIDSDDWVELDMISSMYKKAKEDGADIVICDLYSSFENKEIYSKEKYDFIKTDSEFSDSLLGVTNGFLPIKLVSKELYDKIDFPNFSLFEDVYISLQLFYFHRKKAYLPYAYYHYNQINLSSIVSGDKVIMNEEKIDCFRLLYNAILNFLIEKKIYEKYKIFLDMRIMHLVMMSYPTDTIKYLKLIDKNLANIKLIWCNPSLSFKTKIKYSFRFLGLEKINELLIVIYKKIK
ncbi:MULTISPECIES: glycosyltransferase family 2 protein [unclassified Campylobacter]|uniref:glycosyltransferase family 2 protein n=1 Tax=unclassified Campylobacter TaxID=2593542 RepID=UPI0022E9D9C4|nr:MULTISPECIES: glycosyltransferase family 2 protein [unclassified Campylobacter]MDA3055540.1 glycosyltransferase family 2 protein [Campylobacter sp. CN_NA1]MDA3064770.1 glycosyltransferase family 2 protein [Campylobacter sp. CN_NE4]MDA3068406.1 glycosyltransferase family 2 protein [Campylobacter sp. CN_NE3]MDA3082281.1 glycosyltransferase family 2 protein [Campylobacter sp. CN_EL2]MDA3083916.1 glycosyltransferase family 2 protein [Campylobacter sp. CN_NE1]